MPRSNNYFRELFLENFTHFELDKRPRSIIIAEHKSYKEEWERQYLLKKLDNLKLIKSLLKTGYIKKFTIQYEPYKGCCYETDFANPSRRHIIKLDKQKLLSLRQRIKKIYRDRALSLIYWNVTKIPFKE